MRILLVHNPNAGKEEHSAERLMAALKQANHRPIYLSSKEKGLKAALRKKFDVVLVAGGDGTVAKVARQLVKMGSKIPLSVLPLGTANNVARALGLNVPAKEVIAGLTKGKSSRFDVGLARGPGGKRYFFEGAGAGLLADYFRAPKQEKGPPAKSKSAEMRRHVNEMRRRLRNYRARKWQFEIDGQDFSGRYLLWEVMNIPSVGPVLTLAPDARPNDSRFDFVAAREEDRAALLKYLNSRAAGKKSQIPLPTRHFKTLRAEWKRSPLHFDDEIWPAKGARKPRRAKMEIAVAKSALWIWKPQTAKNKTKKRPKTRPPVQPKKSTEEILDSMLQSEHVRALIQPFVEEARADLREKTDAVMSWRPVPSDVFGGKLPTGIESGWVFILRAGANTGPERHPNSHQRMMSFEGRGDLQTGELDVWKSNALTSDPSVYWQERWISIPPNIWHQPVVPNESDWVVVSFHTVPAEELIEERPDEEGATKQMKYLQTDNRAPGQS